RIFRLISEQWFLPTTLLVERYWHLLVLWPVVRVFRHMSSSLLMPFFLQLLPSQWFAYIPFLADFLVQNCLEPNLIRAADQPFQCRLFLVQRRARPLSVS